MERRNKAYNIKKKKKTTIRMLRSSKRYRKFSERSKYFQRVVDEWRIYDVTR